MKKLLLVMVVFTLGLSLSYFINPTPYKIIYQEFKVMTNG